MFRLDDGIVCLLSSWFSPTFFLFLITTCSQQMTLMPSSLSAPHKPPITLLASPAIAALLHAGVRGGTPRGRSRATQADYAALQLPAQIAGAPGRGTNHICSLPHCPIQTPGTTLSACVAKPRRVNDLFTSPYRLLGPFSFILISCSGSCLFP